VPLLPTEFGGEGIGVLLLLSFRHGVI
jgi:hypothetical protein